MVNLWLKSMTIYILNNQKWIENHMRRIMRAIFISRGFRSASGYLGSVRCLAFIRRFILWRVSDGKVLLVCWKCDSTFLCNSKVLYKASVYYILLVVFPISITNIHPFFRYLHYSVGFYPCTSNPKLKTRMGPSLHSLCLPQSHHGYILYLAWHSHWL